MEDFVGRTRGERKGRGGTQDGSDACGAGLKGGSEDAPVGGQKGDAVLEELAVGAGQQVEKLFFDRFGQGNIGIGLAERAKECLDGFVVEDIDEGAAGRTLMHGVGTPKVEGYGIVFIEQGIIEDES